MSKSPAVHGIWMIGALPSRARTGQRAQPAAADRHAAPGGAVPGAASWPAPRRPRRMARWPGWSCGSLGAMRRAADRAGTDRGV